jgi:hypothetical protein
VYNNTALLIKTCFESQTDDTEAIEGGIVRPTKEYRKKSIDKNWHNEYSI